MKVFSIQLNNLQVKARFYGFGMHLDDKTETSKDSFYAEPVRGIHVDILNIVGYTHITVLMISLS